jgi:hypothetical protein
MILVSMTQFVKNLAIVGMEVQSLTHQLSERANRFKIIQNYADFLLKDIEKGMVVPCDELGNVLEEPLQEHYTDCNEEQNARDWLYNLEKYKEAQSRVLFKGFKVVDCTKSSFSRSTKSITNESGIIHLFWFDNITKTWNKSFGLESIESLSQFNCLELTETAKKEIGYD